MKFKIFAIGMILVLTVLLVQAQMPQPKDVEDTVWLIEGSRRTALAEEYFDVNVDHNIIAVIIVPEPVTGDVVGAAWTYAVRYGADGLDLVNFERAIEIIMERHPTWRAYPTKGYLIRYDQTDAVLDSQDPTLTPETTTNP